MFRVQMLVSKRSLSVSEPLQNLIKQEEEGEAKCVEAQLAIPKLINHQILGLPSSLSHYSTPSHHFLV